MSDKIFYAKPSITELEINFALDALINGWGEHCYDYITRFEDKFKNYLGVDFAIATSSCTGALHMGLSSLGVGPGDEVILADINWIATAAPILYLGAKPVFVDILSETWCIDPVKVEQSINSQTKAIIITHLYGNLCDMKGIFEIAQKHKIPIIEDAAEGIGSQYEGKLVGSMGSFGVFSFHGTKTLSTGEGGMFVTNDADLYNRVLTLSNHGRTRRQIRDFFPTTLGFKYKMTNVQAAIGCGQLERINVLVEKKREILNFYRSAFSEYHNIKLNPEQSGTINGSWMPTLVFNNQNIVDISALIHSLREQGIDARVFFPPLSSLPMFENVTPNQNAYSISKRALNLPSFHEITQFQLQRVTEAILVEAHKQRYI